MTDTPVLDGSARGSGATLERVEESEIGVPPWPGGPEAWPVRPGEPSRLDIVPNREGDRLTLTVLWDGKPLPGAEVVVQGGTTYEEGETDADGRFACEAGDPDLYSIRAKHVEAKPGERDGKTFGSVRHYATLTLELE